MSIFFAAKNFKIPSLMLRNRIKGLHNKIHGSDRVLSVEDEVQLSEWIVLCDKISGYPKTKIQIRKTAAEIGKLSANKVFRNGIPTNGWFKSFCDRHPEVRKRTPESIGTASTAITDEVLQKISCRRRTS